MPPPSSHSFRPPSSPPAAAAPAPSASTPPDADDLRLVQRIQAGEPSAWSILLARYQDRLYSVCLRMVADRDTAADLTQDAMVKIIQGLASFDGRSKLSTWLIRVTMNVCLSHLRGQKLRKHASLDTPGPSSHDGPADPAAGAGGPAQWASRTDTGRPSPRGNVRTTGFAPPRGGSEPPGDGFRAPARAVARAGPGGWGGGAELSPDQHVQREEEHRQVSAALSGLPPEQRSILVLRDVQGLDYDQIAEALGVAVGTVKSRLFRARLALREAIEGGGTGSEPGQPENRDATH